MNAGALKRRSSRYICCDGTREASAEDAEVTPFASHAGIYILHLEADTQWAFLQAVTSMMHSLPFSFGYNN